MWVGTEVLIFESMRYKCHVIELSDQTNLNIIMEIQTAKTNETSLAYYYTFQSTVHGTISK